MANEKGLLAKIMKHKNFNKFGSKPSNICNIKNKLINQLIIYIARHRIIYFMG
jgi:hypothetical protein